MNWFVAYLPSGVFSHPFSSYRDARGEAQAECQTDKSPKRIAAGFYSLCANDHDVQIGTAKAFRSRGYEVR